MPERTEYTAGENVPSVKDNASRSMDPTRWRCTQCGEEWEARVASSPLFGNCVRCGGSGWAFVGAQNA